ncbi:T9SS type A sorting domain-containing protein [Hymenobacter sp. BT683]|uniref:T9SS type A sorting domain-containing protein n=1 Tax=Hymenobacter jeongseonensis TaxID=2791027 RepID=A0ABS0IHE2_9BACT|nr:T9SS type A sorting domain-containing protein [Hymenobacter jeongseonensis]MBF9237780.1 T9SS type A sorting domain-containing protein [Hymenobacter jeongseonensis]
MKKHYYMLSAALLLAGAAQAQGTELFFSEYAEGAHQSGVNYGGTGLSTGNERALEIYNPTNNVVSLAPYSIRRYSNGSATVVEEEKLFRSNATQQAVGANTLPPQSTFVIANGQATLNEIVNNANQFSAAYLAGTTTPTVIVGGGTVFFNGDDAMALVRYPSGVAGQGTGVIIDIIGVIGSQPAASGTGGAGNWSGTNPADGTPPVYASSANQTLIRRPDISTGVKVNPAAATYNIADEWISYSRAFNGTVSNPGGQLYDQLGQHLDYTGPHGAYQTVLSSKLAKFDANISVYPNPAHGTATVEIKDAKVGSVVVINNLGQRISAQGKGQGQEKLSLDISGLKAGLYFVQVIGTDGQTKVYKELVVE